MNECLVQVQILYGSNLLFEGNRYSIFIKLVYSTFSVYSFHLKVYHASSLRFKYIY